MNRAAESIYEHDVFEKILKDAIHPGGLHLTRHLAEIANIWKGSVLLDIACGKGASAKFLSESFGCQVFGLDSSRNMIGHSKERLKGSNKKMVFIEGDGQHLPFLDSSFDFVLLECTFSIFEDKQRASDEAYRVLTPGGKLLMTDLYLKESSVQRPIDILPCAAGALSERGYVEIFHKTGFVDLVKEDHSKALQKIFFDIVFHPGYG